MEFGTSAAGNALLTPRGSAGSGDRGDTAALSRASLGQHPQAGEPWGKGQEEQEEPRPSLPIPLLQCADPRNPTAPPWLSAQ